MLQTRDEWSETQRYLWTKYRELREQFTTLRNRFDLIECAWCKRCIRWKHKAASAPGDTSHGICLPCAVNLLRKRPTAISPTPQSEV